MWVLVDSCVTPNRIPKALEYLESLGLDPAQSVALIVATHWHDDHIRGMAHLAEVCDTATFCCASVFCKKEFLALVGALANRPLSAVGSGVDEMYRVFSHLGEKGAQPTLALANRRIFVHGGCEIWSLSPDDAVFIDFLKSLDDFHHAKVRPRYASPVSRPTRSPLPSGSASMMSWCCWVRIWRREDGSPSSSKRRGRLGRHQRSRFHTTDRRTPMSRVYGSGCWSPTLSPS